jgi:hypothetical protein
LWMVSGAVANVAGAVRAVMARPISPASTSVWTRMPTRSSSHMSVVVCGSVWDSCMSSVHCPCQNAWMRARIFSSRLVSFDVLVFVWAVVWRMSWSKCRRIFQILGSSIERLSLANRSSTCALASMYAWCTRLGMTGVVVLLSSYSSSCVISSSHSRLWSVCCGSVGGGVRVGGVRLTFVGACLFGGLSLSSGLHAGW